MTKEPLSRWNIFLGYHSFATTYQFFVLSFYHRIRVVKLRVQLKDFFVLTLIKTVIFGEKLLLKKVSTGEKSWLASSQADTLK